MSIAERVSAPRPPVSSRRPGEMTWLAAIAFAILVVHILAASLLLPGGPARLLGEATASSTD